MSVAALFLSSVVGQLAGCVGAGSGVGASVGSAEGMTKTKVEV